MWNIRQHLQADLRRGDELAPLSLRTHAGEKPTDSALPCVVWRVVKLLRGEELDSDDTTREATFELVIWASSLEACLAIVAALESRYHGTHSYEFGGRGDVGDPDYEAPIDMGSSRLTAEYDGDRVSNTFAEAGAVALTVEVEFMWVET